jgi:anti-anti-sigma regulatory factor
MAKYRHKIFEMYEFRDEAVTALRPGSHRSDESLPTAAASCNFKHLVVSPSAAVTHVRFTQAEGLAEATAGELRDDLNQLSANLPKDSRVLLDFTDVTALSPAACAALSQFKQKLKMRGSRMVLCCLTEEARDDMFAVCST